LTPLRGDEGGDHSIEVVEEADEVEGQFDPALPLAAVQHLARHDVGRVVQARAGHDGARSVPVDMVGDEGRIEEQGEPLPAEEEQQVEEDVQHILRQHQRVQTVALINGILVVRLQFIKRDNMKNGEENEESVNGQCTNV